MHFFYRAGLRILSEGFTSVKYRKILRLALEQLHVPVLTIDSYTIMVIFLMNDTTQHGVWCPCDTQTLAGPRFTKGLELMVPSLLCLSWFLAHFFDEFSIPVLCGYIPHARVPYILEIRWPDESSM